MDEAVRGSYLRVITLKDRARLFMALDRAMTHLVGM